MFEGGRLQQREQQTEGGGEAAEECRTSLCQGPRPNTLWVVTHLLPTATPHARCLQRVFLAVSGYDVLNPVGRWDRAKCLGYMRLQQLEELAVVSLYRGPAVATTC